MSTPAILGQRKSLPVANLHTGRLHGLERGKRYALFRNPTPIAAFQHNRFNEGYFKGTFALHRGRNELKTGGEADTTFLHENFRYTITDSAQFDPDTPGSLVFTGRRPDLEQSAFIEDLVRMNNWTASVGLRWDHYQLLLNKNAISPRISVGRSFAHKDLEIHASYDRVFQTPSFENILISSSSQVKAFGGDFLRLPIQPSIGNDWEIGAIKGIAKRARLGISTYWTGARAWRGYYVDLASLQNIRWSATELLPRCPLETGRLLRGTRPSPPCRSS